MNILHVNMSMDRASGGGTVERTIQLINACNNNTLAEARVITTDASLDINSLPLRKDKMYILKCINKRWYIPMPNIFKIIRAVKWSDVVHLTNHWTLINVYVYFICRLLSKPYVMCPAGALEIFGRSGNFKKIYNIFFGKRMLRNASRLIGITKQEVEYLKSYASMGKLTSYIPNGVNLKDYINRSNQDFRKKINLHKDSEYILYVGRLNKIKGIDLLVESFINHANEFRNIMLVIAGPDEGLKSELELSINKSKFNKQIIFAGFISGDLKASAYKNALFTAIPSRKEAMSIVALESAICSTPVLYTTACGFPEIQQANGGIEIGEGVDEIYNGIKKMIKLEKKIIRQMGMNARELVVRDYTWENSITKYIDIYNNIITN